MVNENQAQANIEYLAQLKSQEKALVEGGKKTTAEEIGRLGGVRAVQRRTKLGRCERKISELRGFLRFCPTDTSALAEAAAVEALYRELLLEV